MSADGAASVQVNEAGPLRRDAERNRERIVAAARQAYAEAGLEVSMAEVARRAGVGIATLFRRFPAREDLIDAVFADRMDAYVEAADRAWPIPTRGTVSPASSKPSVGCRPPIAGSQTF